MKLLYLILFEKLTFMCECFYMYRLVVELCYW